MRQQAIGTLAIWLRKGHTVEVHVSPAFPIHDFTAAFAEAIPGTIARPGPGHCWEFKVKS